MSTQATVAVRSAWWAAVLVLGLGGLAGAGCLGDAPRGNPLDPESDNFTDAGRVVGRATRYYAPHAPVAGVEVRLTPGPYMAHSREDGHFEFRDVPSGRYRIVAEKADFAVAEDSVTVLLGETTEKEMRLGALPRVVDLALETVHISRWWPVDDLYLLEVSATVEDPDGIADIEAVWLEIPEFGFTDTLQSTRSHDRFATSLNAARLPTRSLHGLMGHAIYIRARDRAGYGGGTDGRQLVRIIEETPVASTPRTMEVVDPRPVLTWEPEDLPYPFTFRVDIILAETNVQPIVQTVAGIASTDTTVRLPEALPPGNYQWTISVVDAFGNRSRSKEAGFEVR